METATVIAISAVLVSAVSAVVSAGTARAQRRHMRLSVRPIAAISVADYEDSVGVSLENRGIGPMRIESLRVTRDDGVTHDDLISHMPSLDRGILWSTFREGIDGAALEAGRRLDLLRLDGDPEDSAYVEVRDQVRRALARLVAKVEYRDLYGKAMEPATRNLSWFGRHFEE